MQPANIQTMTVEQFDEWVYLPENINTNYEYIGGDIIPVVSNSKSSAIAGEIIYLIKAHFRSKKMKGLVTVPDGGYIIGGERYMPMLPIHHMKKRPVR